jgi:hypothetical protein
MIERNKPEYRYYNLRVLENDDILIKILGYRT